LGRLVEVLYERLRNADDHWKPNDLFDMQFLPCAAGYVDVLVGEKKASELLRLASERVVPGAFVCRNIPEATSHLRSLDAGE
jgi:hypothetical protein